MSVSEFSNKEITYIHHRGVKRESPDAKLFMTDSGDLWIPKRRIQAQDKQIFAIPTWFARKKGIKAPINGDFQ